MPYGEKLEINQTLRAANHAVGRTKGCRKLARAMNLVLGADFVRRSGQQKKCRDAL